ncbi:MAG: hypothetical protein ACO3A4_08280 [Silvanigrellaceae bacterium]
MKRLSSIISNFASFLLVSAVVACGNGGTSQSTVQDATAPDYKTKDGQSIMDWIKKNENKTAVCNALRSAKQQGMASGSSGAIQLVAKSFDLHPTEAEIVALYAIEYTCPELQ